MRTSRHGPSRPPRGARLLLRVLPRDLRTLVRQDLDEEFEAIRASRGPGAAARWYWEYALRSLVDATVQEIRDWSFRSLLGGAWADVRLAARSLRRSPAFTLSVVATLAVALGGATTISGLVHTVFWAQLPMGNGDRLVRLLNFSYGPEGQRQAYNMNSRDFLAIREGSRVFEGVTAQNGYTLSVLTDAGARSTQAQGVSEGWGRVLGVRPFLGRMFTPDEEALGEDAGVALVSHALWQEHFGGRPDVLDRTLRFDGGELAVVGVLPPGFAFPNEAEVWTPRRFRAVDWTNHDLGVLGVLREGVAFDAVREDLDRIWVGLEATAPGTLRADGLEPVMAREHFISGNASSLEGLAAAVVFLVLLACANIASLFTVRFVARGHETALRAALGAGRLRLFRMAVAESVVVFLLGGLLGLGVAVLLGDAASALIPVTLRTELDLTTIRLGGSVVAFALGLALLAGLVTGAVAASRATRLDLNASLKAAGRGGRSVAAGPLQNVLVVAELALALVLLMGASVMADHFRRLNEADLGFGTEGLYAVQLAVQQERYLDPDARAALARSLEASMAAVPGVQAVGLTSVNPLCCGDWGARIRVEGMEQGPDDPPIIVHHRYVTTGYFDALGLGPTEGRLFGPEDVGGRAVVLVDEAAAQRFWPGESAVGKRLGRSDPTSSWIEVVGVVPSTYQEGEYGAVWYLPFYQDPTGRSADNFHLMVRVGPGAPLAEVRRAVTSVDPTLAVERVASMRTLRRERIAPDLTGAVVAGMFGGVGLLLACLGLYGLLAYQVSLKRHEIGTHLALGARGQDIVASVLRRTLRLVAVGAAAGTVLAYGLNALLRALVEGVRLAGPGLFAGAAVVLAAAALVAATVPAVRAARLDPARVLRAD